jgi:hypothetical protein
LLQLLLLLLPWMNLRLQTPLLGLLRLVYFFVNRSTSRCRTI